MQYCDDIIKLLKYKKVFLYLRCTKSPSFARSAHMELWVKVEHKRPVRVHTGDAHDIDRFIKICKDYLALTLPVQDLEFYSTAKPTPYESDCPLSDIENNSKENPLILKFVTGTLRFYTNRFCLPGHCCGHKDMFTLLHFSLC